MAQQLDMIPVSTDELIKATFRIVVLLQEDDDAVEVFKLTQESHKDHRKAIKREISEHRATIRRAMLEAESGGAREWSSILMDRGIVKMNADG